MEINELFLKALLCYKVYKYKTITTEILFTKSDELTPDKLIEIAEWWRLRYNKVSGNKPEKMAGTA